jgi:hypothetical protein
MPFQKEATQQIRFTWGCSGCCRESETFSGSLVYIISFFMSSQLVLRSFMQDSYAQL